MSKIRIDRFLAQENFGTRKHSRKLVKDGLVSIDDIIIKDPSTIFDTEKNIVKVDGEIIEYKEDLFFLLNKPADYMCSTIDEKYPSVLRLLPEQYEKRLKIVGRLDADTTGVLLLTSDGKVVNYLAHPKNNIGKTYRVYCNHKIPLEMIEKVKTPLDIGRDEMSSGAIFSIVSDDVADITLFEGKYHEVKRIFKIFNLEVIKLDRIRFQDFTYGDLKQGEYRQLNEEESLKLLKAAHPERYEE